MDGEWWSRRRGDAVRKEKCKAVKEKSRAAEEGRRWGSGLMIPIVRRGTADLLGEERVVFRLAIRLVKEERKRGRQLYGK
jgi:hypothetical protein